MIVSYDKKKPLQTCNGTRHVLTLLHLKWNGKFGTFPQKKEKKKGTYNLAEMVLQAGAPLMQSWLEGSLSVIFALQGKHCNQNHADIWDESGFKPCRGDFHI